MKINLLNNILVGFFTVVISASCSMIKNVEAGKVVKVLNEKKLLDSIKEYELDIQWLKARGNALITINNEAQQEIDLNIRSKADSLIWLNISKFKKKYVFLILYDNNYGKNHIFARYKKNLIKKL